MCRHFIKSFNKQDIFVIQGTSLSSLLYQPSKVGKGMLKVSIEKFGNSKKFCLTAFLLPQILTVSAQISEIS